MRGDLRRRGVATHTLTALDLVDVAYAYMADAARDGSEATRAQLDVTINRMFPDFDSWGTDPQAVAAHRAMMNLAGGPAPQRPRPQPEDSP